MCSIYWRGSGILLPFDFRGGATVWQLKFKFKKICILNWIVGCHMQLNSTLVTSHTTEFLVRNVTYTVEFHSSMTSHTLVNSTPVTSHKLSDVTQYWNPLQWRHIHCWIQVQWRHIHCWISLQWSRILLHSTSLMSQSYTTEFHFSNVTDTRPTEFHISDVIYYRIQVQWRYILLNSTSVTSHLLLHSNSVTTEVELLCATLVYTIIFHSFHDNNSYVYKNIS